MLKEIKMRKYVLPMNAVEGNGTAEPTEPTEPASEPAQKFFSQDELDAIIDRRIARERKNFNTEKEKLEKLSKMSVEEKTEQIRQEQAQKMAEYIEKAERLEAKQFAQETLAEYGMPNSFADFVLNKDKEIAIANVKLLKTAFDNAVQDKVKATLQADGTNPAQLKTETSSPISTKRMSLAELQKAYEANKK